MNGDSKMSEREDSPNKERETWQWFWIWNAPRHRVIAHLVGWGVVILSVILFSDYAESLFPNSPWLGSLIFIVLVGLLDFLVEEIVERLVRK